MTFSEALEALKRSIFCRKGHRYGITDSRKSLFSDFPEFNIFGSPDYWISCKCVDCGKIFESISYFQLMTKKFINFKPRDFKNAKKVKTAVL